MDALNHGVIDCVFPVNLTPYDGEEKGVLAVSTPIETEMYAVVRTSGRSDFSLFGEIAVAVNQGNTSYETFLMDNFPNWKPVYFDTSEDCLRGIAAGEADCMLMSNYRVGRISELLERYKLTTLTTGTDMVEYFAVRRQDSALYSILNKATVLVPSSVINAALTHYSFVESKVTLATFLRSNILGVLIAFGIILAVILTLLFRSRRSERETRNALSKIEELNTEQEKRLKEIAALNAELEKSQQNLRNALSASEQANRAKTSFLSSMSHEIRTPMNALIGLDSIALKDPDLPPKIQGYLEKIAGSARHLLGLINDILDMSRIESGRMTVNNDEFSFIEMLEQVNTIIGTQCREKGLEYDCVIASQICEFFIGDDMKLKQVLINILGNAVKFTDAPGRVSLTIDQTAEYENQATLRFTVKDTGIGIDEEYLPRIFDAFTQEDGATTNQYGGTGLGLAITKNIVEIMNGTISVESAKGVGSTFTVQLSLQKSETKATPAVALNPAQYRVLIVDDDPVACEHARFVMDELGIAADSCLNGEDAIRQIGLRRARQEPYNLILVDWKMPDMDGLTLTREIRKLYQGDAAVVILTAYNWEDIADDAIASGVDSFMSKPLFPATVMQEFAKIMHSITANAFDEDVQRSLQAGMNAHLTKPVEPERLFDTLERLIPD